MALATPCRVHQLQISIPARPSVGTIVFSFRSHIWQPRSSAGFNPDRNSQHHLSSVASDLGMLM